MTEAKYNLIVCSNDETLCDGYYDDDRVASAYVEAACAVIREARVDGKDVDYETDSFFANWHGGRHTKFQVAAQPWGYSMGWVCCHEQHVPKWVKELIDRADEAGSKARDEAVAECEADEARWQAELAAEENA